jgi:hypothetical protein
MIEPDLNGFRDAMVTLTEKLGADVPFFKPTATVWPSGVPLDPETGAPYDPTIEPQASGFASAAVRCSVVSRNAQALKDEALAAAIGEVEESEVVLVCSVADFDAHVDGATKVLIYGEELEITQSDLDGIGQGPPHRAIVRARQ